jgi:hypothetical protein
MTPKRLLLFLSIFFVGTAAAQTHIRLNQPGFTPAATKSAIIFSRDPHINDYSTNEPTMDGTASAILLFVLKDR